MKTKLSVIIPTYTPKDYLWECMDCIQKQTLDISLFEVILVLNGEKEPYFSYIKERSKKYNFNLNVLYSSQKGVSHARNMGLEYVQGEYVTFIDDDDLISETYLQQLLENAGSKCVVEANVKAFNNNTKQEVGHYLNNAYKKYNNSHKNNLTKNRSFLSSACCKLIPTDIIGSQRFNTNLTHGEDSFFMFTLSKKIKFFNITNKDAIYYVRMRDTSASRNKNNRKVKKKMEMKLLFLYTAEYLKHPFSYNFLFYTTRILATFRKLITE